MKKYFYSFSISLVLNTFLYSQTVNIKDGSSNTLLQINDEGSAGSIIFPSVGSILSGNKLYSNGTNLFWGNAQLNGSGGATSIDGLTDAKYDGYSLFLGEGAGINDDETSNYNTAIGKDALYSNTNGYYNTANGYFALNSNTTGSYNTANGNYTLPLNTIGNFNTANGYGSLYSNSIGNYNTANGYQALSSNTTGSYNTANGSYALYLTQTGNNNTAVGYNAGPNTGGGALNNTTAIGYDAKVTASNTISIGNFSVTSIKGKVAFTTFSDGRYKQNVQENVKGLSFILGLRPITYNLDISAVAEKLGEDMRIDENGNRVKQQPNSEILASRSKKESVRQSGFVAQEVEELANKIGYDFSGIDKPQNEDSFYGLRYAEFVVPLVKAVQEQQVMIKNQNSIIEKLTQRIEELESRK